MLGDGSGELFPSSPAWSTNDHPELNRVTMHATDLIFPVPRQVRIELKQLDLPDRLTLAGEPVPVWLKSRLAQACERTSDAPVRAGGTMVSLHKQIVVVEGVSDPALLEQAYVLRIDDKGAITIAGPTDAALRHGLVTLCLLMEAAGRGAILSPMTITDAPAFRVRGVQLDMAREFFPGTDYLHKVIDRLVDLKANTLWLYIENHVRVDVPGLEDISQKAGLTPDQARAVSAYGRERGIDVVPGTNLLSHMEGWFRLERFAHLADGAMRSYPVLSRPESWELVQKYLDALADAFPSQNFHAGLDELLFVGTNPDAQAALNVQGKPTYYADFALKVIDHLQARGKTVWIWDDMVLGKNVYRKEGFNDAYREALDRIPRDVIMTHWYYWDNADGMHTPIMTRVSESGRPFVVAPASQSFTFTYPVLTSAADNQNHMAECGLKSGAFGYINTHWESRYGSAFESSWPCLGMGLGYAWHGSMRMETALLRMSFTMTGDSDNALGQLLLTLADLTRFIEEDRQLGHCAFRSVLFLEGPHQLWRRLSPNMSQSDWLRARDLLAQAWRQHAKLGGRDPELVAALRMPIDLYELGLNIVEAFDHAWEAYHEASLIERDASQHARFHRLLSDAIGHVSEAASLTRQLQRTFIKLEATGHTPYDSYALGRWVNELNGVCDLILDAAHDKNGLPYFEKLLYLPDAYHVSNLRQLQVQNTFHSRYKGQKWMHLKSETPTTSFSGNA